MSSAASGFHRIRLRARRGYALLGVVVLIAVFAVLAGAVGVNAGAVADAQRISDAADQLLRIENEIIGTAPSFFRNVERNPRHLTQLIEPITNQQQNSCGQNYTNQQVDNWKGPYHLVPHENGDFFLARGFIAQSLMERVPPGQSPTGTLFVVIPGVAAADAEALDIKVDGVINGGAGQVRYPTPLGTAPVTVRYGITISGC